MSCLPPPILETITFEMDMQDLGGEGLNHGQSAVFCKQMGYLDWYVADVSQKFGFLLSFNYHIFNNLDWASVFIEHFPFIN